MSRLLKPGPEAYRGGALGDAEARERALDMRHSVIVKAPAGSGKTTLLVQRFLRALARCQQPEEVVAITFTRKAAAEMRQRLTQLLHQKPEDPDVAAVLRADAAQGWQLRDNSARLRVTTIDSFCGSITQQVPITSTLGGSGKPTEDDQPLLDQAILRLLADLDGPAAEAGAEQAQQAVRRLLLDARNRSDALLEPLRSLLRTRDRWYAALLDRREQAAAGRPSTQGQRLLTLTAQAALQALDATLSAEDRGAILEAWALRRLEQPEEPLVPGLRDAIGSGRWPPAEATALGVWQQLLSAYVTGKKQLAKPGGLRQPTQGWLAGKPGAQCAKALLKDWQDSGRAVAIDAVLTPVLTHPGTTIPDSVRSYGEALDAALARLVDHLFDVFAESGEVDFLEVSQRANIALSGATDQGYALLERLDQRISHLLVDEMQDTSHTQLLLLRQITAGWQPGDERTLFLVGDPQQSIYSFRNSDVALFIDLWEQQHLGPGRDGVPLRRCELSANFRSLPAVVDFNNRVYAQVFPAHSNALGGSAAFSAAEARLVPATTIAAADPAWVGLEDEECARWHRIAGDPTAAPPSEATLVADEVERVLASTPARSVGVIGRTRSHIQPVIEELDRRGIGYVADDVDSLANRPEVRVLSALARALWHAADDTAWLALLRSPLLGLSWAELLALRQATGPEAERCWPERLARADKAPLPAPARARLQRLQAALARREGPIERADLARLVEQVWHALGGPATLANRAELANVRKALVLLTEQTEGGSAATLEEFRRRLGQSYALPARAEAQVSLMTIHKSKGLEFDHVFVVGAGRRFRGDDKPLLATLAAMDDLLAVPKPPPGDVDSAWARLYRFVCDLLKARRQAEDCRLAYVASTRAALALHGYETWSWDDKTGKPKPPQSNSLAGRIAPGTATLAAPELCLHAGEEPVPQAQEAEHAAADKATPPAPQPTLLSASTQRLPAEYAPRIDPELTLPLRSVDRMRPSEATLNAAESAGGDAPEPRLDRGAGTAEAIRRRLYGDMYHAAMERIAEQGLAQYWQENGGVRQAALAALQPALRGGLRRMGLPEPEVASTLAALQALLAATLDDAQARWILAPRDWARNEYPLAGYLDGQWVSAIIDRAFIEADALWIIDYKSGERSAAAVAEYQRQLATYARLLAELHPGRRMRCALYWARNQTLEELPSEVE